jgi:hypothetical protein
MIARPLVPGQRVGVAAVEVKSRPIRPTALEDGNVLADGGLSSADLERIDALYELLDRSRAALTGGAGEP